MYTGVSSGIEWIGEIFLIINPHNNLDYEEARIIRESLSDDGNLKLRFKGRVSHKVIIKHSRKASTSRKGKHVCKVFDVF